MSNLVFPSSIPGLKIDVSRTPVWGNRIQQTIGQKRLAFSYSTYPLYRYTLNFEVLRSGPTFLEFQKLFGFYTRHGGQFDTFLFVDDEDNAVVTHNFGKGDGVTTDFQLQRTLVASADLPAPASRSYWPTLGDGYEPIFDLNGSPSIFKDAVLQTITTNYMLPGNGLVHFVAAPGAGPALLTWTGSYYRRVAFETDELEADRMVQSWWAAKTIPLISVKP